MVGVCLRIVLCLYGSDVTRMRGKMVPAVKRLRFVSEACQVVRPVLVSVIAIAVVACAMAFRGWRSSSFVMGLLMAGIAGMLVFQVHRAVRQLKHQSRTARQAAAEAERHYVEVLRRIVAFAEQRDQYWSDHSGNVGRLAGRLARKMGLPKDQCAQLELAGQLHDIGLLAVPDTVMQSYARFGAQELRTIQKHPEASYEVLRPLEMLRDVLPAIRHHHERLNGTGYPSGLTGKQIPLGARILAVADAYDAMTHDRPHRRAVSSLTAVHELRRCCPSAYDPACVEALAELMNVPALEEVASPQAAVGLA
jgi:HD-GYP domain-containing protein (c-di-GMP phosphodiesterase class II)